jgi:hypothetical protein
VAKIKTVFDIDKEAEPRAIAEVEATKTCSPSWLKLARKAINEPSLSYRNLPFKQGDSGGVTG